MTFYKRRSRMLDVVSGVCLSYPTDYLPTEIANFKAELIIFIMESRTPPHFRTLNRDLIFRMYEELCVKTGIRNGYGFPEAPYPKLQALEIDIR